MAELLKQVSIPLVCLALGAVLNQIQRVHVAGKLLIYFGAQSCMNIFVKGVLSKTVVSSELNLKGFPAPFFATGIQQVVSFFLFVLLILISKATPKPYTPKRLQGRMEYIAVVCFSLAFALNISLNNFSLSLIPISVNLVIRSCLPIATQISSLLLAQCVGEGKGCVPFIEWLLMIIGVSCAVLVVIAKQKGKSHHKDESEHEHFVFGTLVCVLSLVMASLNLVIAQLLGTEVKMNPLDSAGYMSVPATLFLVLPVFLMQHPINWPEESIAPLGLPGQPTDWQIFQVVRGLSPHTVVLAFLFGPMAFCYNILQFTMVQKLSATMTSFAGNCNKAALVALTLLVGMETLPQGMWGVLNLLGIVGNIGAFTAYSIVKARPKPEQTEQVQPDGDSERQATFSSMQGPQK